MAYVAYPAQIATSIAATQPIARILIIEDNPDIRAGVRLGLEHIGYEVIEASNGDDGVALALETLPDLIISDVMMPDRDGYSVLQAIREKTETDTIPFIFLTGRVQRDDLRHGMELGADDFISKPFQLEELVKAIQTQLSKRQNLSKAYDQPLTALRNNIIYALPHEVRTPLYLILGFSELMEMDNTTLQPMDIEEMAQAIHAAGMRLHRLFENYLVYAQIEVMATDLEQRAQLKSDITDDVTGEIRQATSNVTPRHGRCNDLTLDLISAPLRISANNLRKIVEELIDNACKFSETGTPVRVYTMREDSIFTIRVQDFGRGMTTSQIQQIGAYMQFERAFYEQQGLGLGLIIVKRLVELHGGRMNIESVLGQGTTVEIHFAP